MQMFLIEKRLGMNRIFKIANTAESISKECPICRNNLKHLFPNGDGLIVSEEHLIRTDKKLINCSERIAFVGQHTLHAS